MKSLLYRPAWELAKLIREKALSPVELMKRTLARIEDVNPALNAFAELRADAALEEAGEIEARIAKGEVPGPLAGIPLGVKDLEDVKGMVTSFGSIPFEDNVAKEDSIQVARLRRAGAIVVGKTNTPEFGFTGFTKNRLHGVTRNPWNLERTPGGSSGGSAAAVAAGMVPLATGSDAGGSIRIPACYCGCFGIKPTFGRIPFGPSARLHITRTWTLGPITRSVADAALYLDCTAGYHPADPESLPRDSFSYLEALKMRPEGLKIGFSPDLGYARVQQDVLALAKRAAAAFENMDQHVELWKGSFPEVGGQWSDLMNRELCGQLYDDLEKIRPELGHTLMKSLENAKDLSFHDRVNIQKSRTELNRVLQDFFNHFDLLLTPAMPTEAFAAKGPPPSEIGGEPIPLLGAVAFTYPFNLSGHPAATVRTGLTESGMPAGLQIVGPRHKDALVLQAAYLYEQEQPRHDHWPDL